MSTSSVIELPQNFGVDFLELAKRQSGKFGQWVLRALFASPKFVDRIGFRARLDPVEPVLTPTASTVASERWIAQCMCNKDTGLTLLETKSPFARVNMEFDSVVTSIAFIHSRGVLVVGLLSGDIEVYNIISATEIKAIYRLDLEYTFPVHVAAGSGNSTFQAILGKGKCVLDFDTIAVVSGNTQVAPTAVDLIQNDIVSCDVLRCSRLLASVSVSGDVVVTCLDSHTSMGFKGTSEPLKCAWEQTTGHLFIFDKSGGVWDCSWNNGLTGVASVPTAYTVRAGTEPSSISRVDSIERVDPHVVDTKFGLIATVIDCELFIYKLVKHTNVALDISTPVTQFTLEKRVKFGSDETPAGVAVLSQNRVAVVFHNTTQKYKLSFTEI